MSRFVIGATFDDAPHLTEEAKRDMLASIPAYQLDARARGIPKLGAGAIYPLAEEEVSCAPFEIPPTWAHGGGMDVGWNRTAGMWFARDPKSGVEYGYAEYYQGMKEPLLHAEAWRAHGLWIPIRIDPAAKGRAQKDGTQLIEDYRALKIPLEPAINAVESGILAVFNKLSTGKLKIFKTCRNFFAEYRMYQRDEKGHIKKTKDHLMDALRYAHAGGTDWWTARPIGWREDGTIEPPDVMAGFAHQGREEGTSGLGWMA